jgi:colanic acid/amylovoran biosynthesis glycosyltransferase
MRIIYVTACLPFGPAEAFVIDELKELLRRHEVLIVPRSPAKPGPHGIELVPHSRRESILSARVLRTAAWVSMRMPTRVAKSCGYLLRSRSARNLARNAVVVPKALWLAQVASEWAADHIHCHWAGTTATMTLIASTISGVPWSLTAHRSDIVGNNLLVEKAASASMVRAISQDGKKMLIERGVKPEGMINVLPMGVAVPVLCRFTPPERPIVLCPADLLAVKGHRYLLHAWRILHDRGIHAELWLAGQGELRSELQQLAESLGISHAVKFLGTMPHAELLEHYANNVVSAVVLASIELGDGCHEGIPVSLVEAMSYGIPVVATRTGGIPELIQPHTGLLVPSRDPIALADAMQRLFSRPAFAQRLGLIGRRYIVRTRDVASVVSTLESFFRESVRNSESILHDRSNDAV